MWIRAMDDKKLDRCAVRLIVGAVVLFVVLYGLWQLSYAALM